jgi:hypothetical protein
MGAALAVQQAVFDKLRVNSTLASLLAESVLAGSPTEPAIYDAPPQQQESEAASFFPYVVIGDDTAAEFDTDDVNGQETTITLHVWSRYRGKREVKLVIDALYDALHDVSLTIAGQSTVYCFWEFAESVPDPDPLIQHGVTRFRIATQES